MFCYFVSILLILFSFGAVDFVLVPLAGSVAIINKELTKEFTFLYHVQVNYFTHSIMQNNFS